MAGFDWIIAAVLLVSTVVGVFRGFMKEALSLASWILAIWLGITFCVEAGELIHQYVQIPSPKFREWAGFAAIFIGTLFVFALISYIVNKLIVRGPIKSVDRALGFGFGAVRGAAIVVAILIVARSLGFDSSDWWRNSQHLSRFIPAVNFVENLLPESWQPESDPAATLTKSAQDKAVETLIDSVPAPSELDQSTTAEGAVSSEQSSSPEESQ